MVSRDSNLGLTGLRDLGFRILAPLCCRVEEHEASGYKDPVVEVVHVCLALNQLLMIMKGYMRCTATTIPP